ncbi:MAG: hypothetical protein EXS05_01420 [Planctomycetaceae bacterium]|nr:hypothetical protein [Planctomycetaceae bacterium]
MVLFPAALPAAEPFCIQVVDAETGRGVPLVELKTVNDIRYYTDSQGVVAFDEPGLEGQSVFFHVKSHGYEFAKDGFGFRGKALTVTPGGRGKLEIKRLNIARRLYRVTGAGIYRDSLLCGMKAPIREPLLNAQVTGSDSVVNAFYRGKIYWFWGDTNRPSYPLGNFHVPGATSLTPEHGGLDPNVGVDLEYFVDEKGFARPTAQLPGEGPTWIFGLTAVRNAAGQDRLMTGFMKVKPPLDVYQRGIAEFDDATNSFRKLTEFTPDVPLHPDGQPMTLNSEAGEHVYFSAPYPLVRVKAAAASFVNLDEYEAYTCLREGSRFEKPQIDSDPDGRVRYAWKRGTPAVGPAEQKKLIERRLLKDHEGLLQLRDRDTGKAVQAHAGSVSWNEFRKRFVMITTEIGGGPSMLGETWYAEAESPVGPWVYAVKVVTHDRYSFYNPKQHALFDAFGGRTIYFEGTYTNTFSGNPDQTPRYDYNQIMYQLDLADPRVALPVAFVWSSDANQDRIVRTSLRSDADEEDAREKRLFRQFAFFACDRPGEKTIAVYEGETKSSDPCLQLEKTETDDARVEPRFHALPADLGQPPSTTVPLYEYRSVTGDKRFYSTDPKRDDTGFQRGDKPLVRVWKNPYREP